MLKDNKDRILSRMYARELSPAESHIVNGGFQVATKTLCTLASDGSLDGDVSQGEC